MKNWIKSTLNPSIIYAGIIGGVYILNAVVIDAFDINFSTYDNVSRTVILVVGIVLAIYAFRKEYNENYISYPRALGFGVLTSVILGLIIGIYMNIFVQYINTDYIALLQQYTEERMIQRGIPSEMIEQISQRTAKMNQPGIMLIRNIISAGLTGLVISLIASIFIKREPKEPFAEEV